LFINVIAGVDLGPFFIEVQPPLSVETNVDRAKAPEDLLQLSIFTLHPARLFLFLSLDLNKKMNWKRLIRMKLTNPVRKLIPKR